MKFKVFLFLLCFFGLERFCHWQTGGFAYGKITSPLPFHSEWETTPLSEEKHHKIAEILTQPFHYLGSGKQFFAFESEDGQTVLKLVKHSRRRRPVSWLNQVRFPFCDQWREQIIQKREKAISTLMKSCKVAYELLPEETGVIYAHLNKTENWQKKLTLHDKLGIVHQIDLDSTEFLLQKKATAFCPALASTHGREYVDALFNLITSHCHKGIANLDLVIHRNLGVCEGKVLAIDFGSLHFNDTLQTSSGFKREVFLELLSSRQWIATDQPQLLSYFDEKLQRFLTHPSL